MRKSNSLKLLLSALLLAIGCNAWGATKTIEISASSFTTLTGNTWTNQYAVHRGTAQNSDNTVKIYFGGVFGKQSTTFAIRNQDGEMIGNIDPSFDASASWKNNIPSDAVGAIPGAITKIEVTCNNSRSCILYVGTSQLVVSSGSVSGYGASDTYTTQDFSKEYDAKKGYCYFAIKGNNSSYRGISKIVITYEVEESDEPRISASNQNISCEAQTGVSFSYSILNAVAGGEVSVSKVSGDFISNVALGDNNTVTFDVAANEDQMNNREGIIRLKYTYTEGTATKDVTINQAKFVKDYATLPLSVEAGISSANLVKKDGVTGTFDGSDYNNDDHKVKFSKNTHFMEVKTDSRIGSCTFSVKGCASAGSSSITIQESADGTDWTDVQSFTVTFDAKDEIQEIIVTKAFNAASRYVKLKFNKLSGNVNFGLGQFTINKYATPVVLAVSDANYATYFNSTTAYIMPENLEGITVDGVEDYTLSLTTTYEAGDVVPAGEALVLHGATGNYDLVACKTYYTTKSEENKLKGTSAADDWTTDGDKYYRLSQHDGQVGFYWGAEGGAAFQPGANKAYLAVSGTNAPARFIFGQQEVPTELQNASAEAVSRKVVIDGRLYIVRDGNMFDLNGRLVK